MGDEGMTQELSAEFASPLCDIQPADLRREWQALTPIHALARTLADRPILLITAGGDQLFPPRHYDGVADLSPRLDWIRFPRADHVFSDVRPGLCQAVGSWLLDQLA